MIVSLFHVQVPAEAATGFEASWTKRAGLVDQMPGFQGLDVLKNAQEPGKYLVLTRWASREDFERWANSPQFAAGHARGPQGQGAGIEFYEVLPSMPSGDAS
ncbi:MAG TPA: antibiotic biosynthesis monooxygenase [Ktedonobacterales bacterium]|nr:antibiotic biosynthesis monooxygenase [Ktedonobacterales bacterium]